MSACRACHASLRPSRAPCLLQRMGAPGAPGHPDLTLEEDGGAPERGRGVQQHATDSIPLASFVRNTGDLWGMCREVERREARAQRNARGPHRSRLGQRSRSVGKPRTPGGGRTAKAPRLRKDGGQREVAHTVPSARASCARAVRRGEGGAMGANTEARLWRPLQWQQRLQARHGEGPQGLRRMRSKPHVRCETGTAT
jgi:hypothetical protein